MMINRIIVGKRYVSVVKLGLCNYTKTPIKPIRATIVATRQTSFFYDKLIVEIYKLCT